MEKAFVFFSNRSNLTSPPISISATELDDFDNNNNKDILIIGKDKSKQLITITENLPKIVMQPYYMLIKDNIVFPEINNGNEIGNSYKLQSILKDIDEVYLVIHKTKPSTYLETFKRIFNGRLKSYIYQNHVSNHLYEKVLKSSLSNTLINDLSNLEDSIVKEFPDPHLESLIHLHKFLKLLPLKGNWNEDSFNKEKKTLENSDSMKLAKNKLDNISFVKDIEVYYEQLKPIQTEIINLSTAK